MCFPNVYLRMRIAMLHDVILVLSICHPPRDNDIIPIADWLDRFGGQNKS